MLFGKKNPAESFPALTPDQLEKQLETATRAEDAASSQYFSRTGVDEAEYPYLSTLVARDDGVWACCCGHENVLVHYSGKFPFKHLRCGKCNHVACSICQMSDILTPQDGALCLDEIVERGQEVRFCFVCWNCGLSYRAVRHAGSIHPPGTCHCGNRFGIEWPRYRIGSVDAYRRDPVKTAHDVKHNLCLRKSEKVYDDAHAESMRKQRLQEELRQEKNRLQAQQPLTLRTQDEWQAKERAQRRPQPLRLPGWTQECNVGLLLIQTPGRACSSVLEPNVVPSQQPNLFILRRSETWTTAKNHERLNEEAHGVVKSTFEMRQYN
ncbi:uncharacterized protein EKO05_0008143 [Ascochyta rabiei]|uniref:uncharacterized protein n=1 Tax=Didymella rabiei TaxID=5454 RepID=UPI0021FBF231|nr:uncharacterized protein EKO05_0008143 [Ascochyta rabiei]UPX17810.1 hypothetical protein EKO05_0008143 [Ascochyta rabiei]